MTDEVSDDVVFRKCAILCTRQELEDFYVRTLAARSRERADTRGDVCACGHRRDCHAGDDGEAICIHCGGGAACVGLYLAQRYQQRERLD